MQSFQKSLSRLVVACSLFSSFSGCWVAAAGVGAEAGYVASQDKRSTGETMDDQLIVTKVKTQLLADSEVSGLNINVDSFKGVVTLKGFVGSEREAQKAMQIASAVSDVKDVRSKLVVDLEQR